MCSGGKQLFTQSPKTWAVQKITGVLQRGLAGEEQQFFFKKDSI